MPQKLSNILVVEDDPHIRRLFGDFLRAKGFGVTTASDGEEGWETWRREKPDLVLLDIFLPKLDGFGLLRRVRQDEGIARTPVIVVTAVYKSEEHEREARQSLGVTDYLVKPFPLHVLERKVREILGAETRGRSSEPSPDDLARFSAIDVCVATIPEKGSLVEHPLAELIHNLYLAGKTGCLTLTWERLKKVVYLLNGYPVWVESTIRGETLGAYLVENGVIPEPVLEQALQAMQKTGQKLGDILIELGALSPNGLFEVLRSHIQQKIQSCFPWKQGGFEFQDLAEFPRDVVVIRLEPARVVIDGLGNCLEVGEAQFFKTIIDQIRCAPNPQPQYSKAQLGLKSSEQRIMDLALAGRPVGEIVEQVRAREPVLRLLHALESLNMVRFTLEVPRSEPAQASREPEPGDVLAEGIPGREEPGNQILRDYMRLKELDYFALLGVQRDAQEADIKRAFEALAERIRPFALSTSHEGPPARMAELGEKAQELYLKIRQAYRTLIDPALRDNYLETLETSTDPSMPQGVPAAETRRKACVEGEEAFRRGESYLKNGEYVMAAKSFALAVKRNGNEAIYYAHLGWAQFLDDPTGNYKTAYENLQMALLLQPDLDFTHYFIGCMLKSKGDTDGAIEYFRTVLKYNPDNARASTELRLLESRSRRGGGGLTGLFSKLLGTGGK
ncbi:MAG: response regulator [Deltaproteobacteria bacterium]|nr:response regulator [Deltaproteobacteria bacterium]